jgi:hypothetical protein
VAELGSGARATRRIENREEPEVPTEVSKAFRYAKVMLRSQRIPFDVSAREFRAWLEADTPWPDMSLDTLLSRPLLVAHELVEIDTVKKMGLRITKSVIVDNPDMVYEAHLKAFEVELLLAKRRRNWSHIGERIEDVQNWIDDPLLPQKLKPKCRALREDAQEALRTKH